MLVTTADGSDQRFKLLGILIWPLTVLLVAWWLKDRIPLKIHQMTELDFLGMKAKFDPAAADRALEEGLGAAALQLQAPVPQLSAADREALDHLIRAVVDQTSQDAIEKITREGAEWGWRYGSRGQPLPDLAIRWSDGVPEILGAWAADPPTQYVNRLVYMAPLERLTFASYRNFRNSLLIHGPDDQETRDTWNQFEVAWRQLQVRMPESSVLRSINNELERDQVKPGSSSP